MKIALAVLDKLLHPSKWVLFSLPLIVFAALTDTLLKGKNSMPAYMIYSMSAYCLTIWMLPPNGVAAAQPKNARGDVC